jgi:hypothetical protein
MGLTNLPHGISSFGVPIYGAHIPPITGDYFHVCPGLSTIINSNGKQVVGSSGNSGESILAPLDSIKTAYDKCTSGAGDGIILWSYGTTTAACTSYLTDVLTWAKHGITVVGMCAPTGTSQRARVANAAASTSLANLITITGNNNTFINMQIGNWGSNAAALGGVIMSGDRNFFGNCHIVGAGHATPAVLTGSYSLSLSGATDSKFVNCTFGTDTVDADGSQVATGTIKLASGCQTNLFDKCRVMTYYSYASAICGGIHHVGAGDSITRTQEFRDCSFINFKFGLPTTNPPLSLVVGTAPNNGVLLMSGLTTLLGYAAYDGTAANDRVFVATPAANLVGGLSVTTA